MVGQAHDVQFCQLGEELMREFLANPILRDDGGNLCLQKVPGPP